MIQLAPIPNHLRLFLKGQISQGVPQAFPTTEQQQFLFVWFPGKAPLQLSLVKLS